MYEEKNGKIKLSAAWLIEKAGWKGYYNGVVGVYEKQSLVLVNYGVANGKQIKDLGEYIRIDIFNRFGVKLMWELNIY